MLILLIQCLSNDHCSTYIAYTAYPMLINWSLRCLLRLSNAYPMLIHWHCSAYYAYTAYPMLIQCLSIDHCSAYNSYNSYNTYNAHTAYTAYTAYPKLIHLSLQRLSRLSNAYPMLIHWHCSAYNTYSMILIQCLPIYHCGACNAYNTYPVLINWSVWCLKFL